jgi:hypothetical protein
MELVRVAMASMRSSAVFMRVSPFSCLQCMKASRDGLALYTMQNGRGERIIPQAGKEYFFGKRE